MLTVFDDNKGKHSPSSHSTSASVYIENEGTGGGGVLLDGLPGLLLKAAVDGLGDGRLHQVDVADHQGDKQVLQVFVERPIAQVSWEGGGVRSRGWGHRWDTIQL